MPIFFQHVIDADTRLGIWKIEETEDFFLGNVPVQREVTHPHKRLQHLAGRFLLQFLFPAFPYGLVRIADTRKPFLQNEQFHFSISHCGDYAAAIVSRTKRVGIDIEIPTPKIEKIKEKFLNEEEFEIFNIHRLTVGQEHSIPARPPTPDLPAGQAGFRLPTLLWSCKEAVFKWYGDGGVDFREHIHLKRKDEGSGIIDCFFTKKSELQLAVHFNQFHDVILAWVIS